MSEPGLQITMEDDGRLVRLVGILDEHAELAPLAKLKDRAVLHLGGVRRINSSGVRLWVDVIREVSARTELELHACSPAIIDQVNMVAGFLGRARVVSFHAPLLCERCGIESEQLFTVEAVLDAGLKLPSKTCATCSGPLVLDDVEDELLLFLREE